MSERVDSAPSRKESRCPFCHAEASREGEPVESWVSCAACGTPHHAECFAENKSCSVAGCGGREARWNQGGEALPVGVIAARLERGETTETRPAHGIFALVAFVAVGIAMAYALSKDHRTDAIFLAVVGAICLAVAVASSRARRPAIRVDASEPPEGAGDPREAWERAYFGAGDPYEPMRRRIEAQTNEGEEEGEAKAPVTQDEAPVAPSAETARPARCSACGNALELDGESSTFCYHCGVSLS